MTVDFGTKIRKISINLTPKVDTGDWGSKRVFQACSAAVDASHIFEWHNFS